MGLWLYLLIGFVVFFFMWKKYGDTFKEKTKMKPGRVIRDTAWLEAKEFYMIVLPAVFWPFAVPGVIIWRLLEKLYTKFN